MYLRHLSTVLICGSLAFGQAATPMPPQVQPGQPGAPAGATAPSTTAIPLDTAVITLKGVCFPATADCATTVSRGDFEKIIQAVQPQMPFKMQRQVATGYSQLLSMSTEARKRGLENSPRVQERTKIAIMQALQRELVETVQEDAAKISDADVEKYYGEHKANYEQADMQRLIIPSTPDPVDHKVTAMGTKGGAKAGAAAAAKTAAKPAPTEASLKALAAKLRARAAAGEDFAKLQAEAYAAARVKTPAPETKMAKVTSSTLPPAQRAAFDLKAGEVSELITDGNSFTVLKMGEKTTKPLADVSTEIKGAIKGERMQQAMESISKQGTPELNDAYFGPAEAPGPRGPGGPGGVIGGTMGRPPTPEKAPH